MKNIILIFFLPLLAGCAYLHDRGRDACDVVTVAAEAPSVNASLQLFTGVLGVGLAGGYGVGLRSGALGIYETGEANFILGGFKFLIPDEADLDREKGYDYQYFWIPWAVSGEEFIGRFEEGKWFNGCQLEAAAGLGLGLRVGLNLAEGLDFLLGWTTLDICGDDVKTMDQEEVEAFEKSQHIK